MWRYPVLYVQSQQNICGPRHAFSLGSHCRSTIYNISYSPPCASKTLYYTHTHPGRIFGEMPNPMTRGALSCPKGARTTFGAILIILKPMPLHRTRNGTVRLPMNGCLTLTLYCREGNSSCLLIPSSISAPQRIVEAMTYLRTQKYPFCVGEGR